RSLLSLEKKNRELRGVVLVEWLVVHAFGVCEKEALGTQAVATPILVSKPGEKGRRAGVWACLGRC
ncbi:unnamed protein product, partial [Ilex paraguariensis]